MTAAAPNVPAFPGWQIICLCADWCGSCREWRPQLTRLARAHPDVRFAWVDIEDQADALGDVDIETFPTLLVAVGGQARFFGPVLPHAGHIERLLASLREDDRHTAPALDQASSLLARLAATRLDAV